MSKMADLHLTIKKYLKYVAITIFIIIVCFLVHMQNDLERGKLKNEIYDLKAEVESLRETIDIYEKNTNNT